MRRSGKARTSPSFCGVINYCMTNDKVQWDYVKAFTNAAFMVKDGFAYHDGSVHRLRREKAPLRSVRAGTTRSGQDGFAVVDETLQNPRCVWNLLKQHVSIYTPEFVERICGTPKEKFLKVAKMIAETLVADEGHDVDVRARLDAALASARRTSAPWRCCS